MVVLLWKMGVWMSLGVILGVVVLWVVMRVLEGRKSPARRTRLGG